MRAAVTVTHTRGTTHYERAGKALTKADLAWAPPPWPLGDDPRTPDCTHDWTGTWGKVGERQRRCRHCRRYIWEHDIHDPEVSA